MKNLFILFFFYVTHQGFSQDDSLTFINKKALPTFPFVAIELDQQENIYVLTSQKFLKLNQHFDTLLTFSQEKNQQIESFQSFTLSNFLFSKEAQKMLTLNRFLTKHSEIKFPSQSLFIELACVSNDQHLWLIDNFELKKYNYQTQRFIFSISLIGIVNEEDIIFKKLTFHENLLFLHSNEGIYIFDNLGNFRTMISTQSNCFRYVENELYFIEKNKLIRYNIFLNERQELKISMENISDFLISEKIIYLIDKDGICWKYLKK